MALTLKAQIPFATTAIRLPHVQPRVFIGHVEDYISCDELDDQMAPVVARLRPSTEHETLEVRKVDDQFYIETVGVDLAASSFPYEPFASSNLFHDGSVHTMFREVFEGHDLAEDLEHRWWSFRRRPVANLRKMGLRDVDKDLVELQISKWRNLLKPPILVNGRLYRRCDEPFIELAVEGDRIRCSLLTDRDWCSDDTYAVYSLPEIAAKRPMEAWLKRHKSRRIKRDFMIIWMDEYPGTFSTNFLYRRFGLWGEAISLLLGWVALSPAERIKFAAELTPVHQSSLQEIDRAVRSEDIWVNREASDAALVALTVLRHDPHFSLHVRHRYADWADILIRELEAAPIVPFGPNALGIGLAVYFQMQGDDLAGRCSALQ